MRETIQKSKLVIVMIIILAGAYLFLDKCKQEYDKSTKVIEQKEVF
jgi:preprotein translocase subunit SecE